MDPAATINIGAEIVFSPGVSIARSVFEVTTGCGDFRQDANYVLCSVYRDAHYEQEFPGSSSKGGVHWEP